MAVCFNTESANRLFDMMVHDAHSVDKSGMIEILSAGIHTMNRYINMLGAYYCKAHDAAALFDGLAISKSKLTVFI